MSFEVESLDANLAEANFDAKSSDDIKTGPIIDTRRARHRLLLVGACQKLVS